MTSASFIKTLHEYLRQRNMPQPPYKFQVAENSQGHTFHTAILVYGKSVFQNSNENKIKV